MLKKKVIVIQFGFLLAATLIMPEIAQADIFDTLKAIGKALDEEQTPSANADPANSNVEPLKPLEAPQVGPGGIEVTCQQVMAISEPSRANVFNIKVNNWTEDTVAFLNQVTDRCYAEAHNNNQGYQNITIDNMKRGDTKQSFLFAYRRAVKEEHELKNKECYKSSNYLIYAKQTDVVAVNEALTNVRNAQAREKLITKESGVRNLAKERALGELAVRNIEMRTMFFADYKKLGGKENSAEKMTTNIPNPCP